MHEQERLLQVLGAEPVVLVVASDALTVQVDVEQLPRPQRLGDGVHEAEAGHRLVRDLRVDADHLGVLEHRDEMQRVPDRRQEDVAARLVGLRLDRKAHVVALLAHVAAEEVDRLAVALERVGDPLAGCRLDALAATPEHVHASAELRAEVDPANRLRDRRAPYRRCRRM